MSSSSQMTGLRQLPPAGTPISAADLLFWVRSMADTDGCMERLRRQICQRFAVRHAFFLSTGRAAMVVVLKVLAEEAVGRDQVVIPSYTCFSVPSSVVKAGLKVRLADLDPATLDYDYDQLQRMDTSGVLAIVSANLYGMPNDLERLESFAAKRRIHLVDDAAQAMGAMVGGRYCGTFGSAGIFSLDKGKVITSMNGGIIVTRDDEIAGRIRRAVEELGGPTVFYTAVEALKTVVYACFINPSRYWLPARLPFLGLGETRYTTDYPIERYPAVLGGMALRLLQHVHRYNEVRRANGLFYREALSGIPGVSLITEQPGGNPIYLRFPLLAEEPVERNRLLEELRCQGLGASCSYPSAITDISHLQSNFAAAKETGSGGKWVAERLVTLPTHPFVTDRDRRAIVETIKTNGSQRSGKQPRTPCSD